MNDEDEFFNTLYGELQAEPACGRFIATTHKALERRLGALPDDARLLEVGGNLGEHCRYVTHPYSEYIVTDHRPVDFTPLNDRVRFEVADVEALPYEDHSFDRVLATCLLHHLDQPEAALREMRRVTRPGGLVSITLPCDPGALYRLGKAVGPYRSIRKRGATKNPRLYHYRQHRNHYPGLWAMIQNAFTDDVVEKHSWPLPLPAWNINMFTIVQARISHYL